MKTTRILFLDDCPNRTKWFLSVNPSAFTFETANDIIESLKVTVGQIDELYLDHDLGGNHFTRSDIENCGMEVVRFLCQEKRNIKDIVVHSLNPVAAKEMALKLDDAGYTVHIIPFYKLKAVDKLIIG